MPEAFDKLIASVERALSHAIEEEEKIPLSTVTNLAEIATDVKTKLADLRDTPNRMENPIIYHLDVGRCILFMTNKYEFWLNQECSWWFVSCSMKYVYIELKVENILQ